MAEVSTVEQLKAKHAELEARLEAEARRQAPDQMAIAEIKRAKLRLKDQIAVLSQA